MYQGTNASSGIGIGTAVIVEEAELVIKREAVVDAEAEVKRFQDALEQTMKDTEALAADLATRVGEKEAEIMQGHLMLLMDPMLTGEIENTIKNEVICSEYAVEQVCTMYADVFAAMEDELMQQRATDMRDIKTRMQQVLMGVSSVDISGRKYSGSKGFDSFYDCRNQSGPCSWHCDGAGRKDFSQRYSGQSPGDSGSGCCEGFYEPCEKRGPGNTGRL